jgi:type IX secretion system substrate protein
MKIKFILIILSLPLFLNAQGGLIIGSGAKVVISNSPQIVINDGKFENNGDFTAGTSTVHLKGSTATEYSTVGGAAVTAFNNLNIQKSSNDVRLDFDILVDGDLEMNGGLLILNYSDIDLGGDIIGETETNRITGTEGGAILKSLELNMPTGVNPGNLGVEITSPIDMGMTTIRRSHVQMVNEGSHSIDRVYDISASNDFGLDATVRFYYFDAELSELIENDLEIWHYDDVEWVSFGSESSNTTGNWVEASGFNSFHTITLAEDMTPLPIELLRFDAIVNENKMVDLFWTTTTETNNDYFTIERSKDGIQFEQIENIQGAGNSTEPRNYQTVDSNPYGGVSYYRLLQTDFDGTQSYSGIRVVNIELSQQYTVYPNPLKEVLHIVSDASARGKTIIEISDALGRIVYAQRIEMGEQINSIDINEVSKFEAGNYFLVIQTADEIYNFNLVKVRE